MKHVDLPETCSARWGGRPSRAREARQHYSRRGRAARVGRLGQAAAIFDREPSAIPLRYLQTLTEIGAKKNSTIIFPLPLEMLRTMKECVRQAVTSERPVEKLPDDHVRASLLCSTLIRPR